MRIGPVASLAFARIRGRLDATSLVIGTVAAASLLMSVISGIGVVASDATMSRAMAPVERDRPVVRVSHFSISNRDLDSASASAAHALERLAPYTDAPVRAMLVRQLVDQELPIVDQVLALEDPTPWLTVIDGRMPAPCRDGRRCEAIVLSTTPLDDGVSVARPTRGLELTIVGRGVLDSSVPFGELDQRGPVGERPSGGTYQTSDARPALLLVTGVDAIASSPALTAVGRTYIWTASIEASAIHPWTLGDFDQEVDATAAALAAVDSAFSVASPIAGLEAEHRRALAATGRLRLVEALGVAVLLAFAVFFGVVTRDDVAAESARLQAAGARLRERLLFRILEATVPAVMGTCLGLLLGVLVVSALAGRAGSDVGDVVSRSVLAPETLVGAGMVLAFIVGAIVVTTATTQPGRQALRMGVAVAATVTVLVAWQLAVSGSLDSAGLANPLASPALVLLAPMFAFLTASAFLLALPPLFRTLSRRIRTGPIWLRLSLISTAREPSRSAASLTVLTLSLSAIVFATGWSASLSAGIADAAAYRSGLDLRVTELGTGLSIAPSVVPVERYLALGDDLAVEPVYRDSAPGQPGGPAEILGIEPAALATLPSWRADYSAIPAAALAERLALPEPAGGWQLSGHRLPGDSSLTLHVEYLGDPMKLDAIIATDAGDSVSIPMGILVDGMTEISARLPAEARGGLLTALIFRHDRMIQGPGHEHEIRRATVHFEGLDGLVDEKPFDVEVFTVSTVIIRAPQATDGLAIPAIVSADLAAEASPDGSLDLRVGNGEVIPLRVAATAARAPTVEDVEPRFVVVPRDPFLVALASAVPGAGRPNEVWIGSSDPARLAEIRDRLAEPPFRFAQVRARADLVAASTGDPLSQSIIGALVAAALIGLTLAVGGLLLGALTDLRDRSGQLADLESQGLAPSQLARHVIARTGWIAVSGAGAGLLAGIGLSVIAVAILSLTPEGRQPVPPLVPVLPVIPMVAAATVPVALILGVVAVLARRRFSGAGGARPAPQRTPPEAWHPEAGGPRV